MPFRQKLKKTFGSKKNGSGSGESSNSGSTSPRRTDIEYYKPNEIPKSKYRGKPDPEVVGAFEAYSFGDAFQSTDRRPSQALSGTFSPGGTQAQSRRASAVSRTKSSLSTSSADNDADDSVDAPEKSDLQENETDNTSSAVTTPFQHTEPSTQDDGADLTLEKTVTASRPQSSKAAPFTAEDLERAMTKATLRPRTATIVQTPLVQPQAVAA